MTKKNRFQVTRNFKQKNKWKTFWAISKFHNLIFFKNWAYIIGMMEIFLGSNITIILYITHVWSWTQNNSFITFVYGYWNQWTTFTSVSIVASSILTCSAFLNDIKLNSLHCRFAAIPCSKQMYRIANIGFISFWFFLQYFLSFLIAFIFSFMPSAHLTFHQRWALFFSDHTSYGMVTMISNWTFVILVHIIILECAYRRSSILFLRFFFIFLWGVLLSNEIFSSKFFQFPLYWINFYQMFHSKPANLGASIAIILCVYGWLMGWTWYVCHKKPAWKP